MRRRDVAIAVAVLGLGVAGGLVAWRLVPGRLGLERSRVVLAAGDASVEGAHTRPGQVLATGLVLRTGRGSLCFSIHGSRVCLGANTEAVLSELGEASGVVLANRGTVIASSAGDDVRIVLPSGAGAVSLRAATAAIEDVAGATPSVRALEGTVKVEASGQPDRLIAAPDTIDQRDGKKRPAAPSIEGEERAIAKLAGSWQGTAGGTIEIEAVRGHVEVDGTDVGIPPAGLLLVEGSHTVIAREGGRETTHQTVKLGAGEKVVVRPGGG